MKPAFLPGVILNKVKKLCLFGLLHAPASLFAADANVVIPWQNGATFSTNISLYTTMPGETKTLSVTPQGCYRFTAPPSYSGSGVTIVQTSYSATGAGYDITIIGPGKEGTATVAGSIEPDPACASGSGGTGTTPTQPFDISVLQRQAWIYFTNPANGTNLTTCAGCTNDVAVKVVLGNSTAPSSGTASFSASPTALGTFTPTSVALDSAGAGAVSFTSTTNGGLGTITANGIYLADASGTIVPDVSKEMVANVIKVTQIDVFKTNTTTWAATDKLPWTSVILRNTDFRFTLTLNNQIGAMTDFPCTIQARTYSAAADPEDWKTIPLDSNDVLHTNGTEIRVILTGAEVISLGLLAATAGDALDEFTSADRVANAAQSNHNDGDMFDNDFAGAGKKQRGKARDDGDVAANPPESAVNKEFMTAGGVRFIEIRAGGAKSQIRQIHDQADWLYYSGHGDHSSGRLSGADFLPADAQGKWNQDLKTVVFAGCSVLDIKDYNNRYGGADHTASPGEKWIGTGPTRFFGYCFTAPIDTQGGDPNATATIVHDWFTTGRTAANWIDANNKEIGYNACAIDLTTNPWEYRYFHRKLQLFPPGFTYVKSTVQYDTVNNKWPDTDPNF